MATRTISNAGGNYNDVATWVEGIIPTSADDVISTITSGNLVVNVASAAKTITFTAVYTGTLTVNNTLTMSGDVVFGAGMTIAGTGIIEFAANANLTSNGKTFTGSFSFSGSRTLTLLDDARIKGLGSPNAAMTTTINGFSLYSENFTQQNAPVWQGTVNLILNPAVSGAWATSGTGGLLLFSNPIQINCPGADLTISGAIQLAGGGLTHVASNSVNASAATLNLSGTHSVNVGSAVKFGSVNTTLSAGTITLISDLWSLGGASLLLPTLNGSKLYVGGSFGTAFNTNPTGTTEVVLNGSGNISTPNHPLSTLRNPLTIDTVGTYTQTTNITIATTFKHVSGTLNQGVYFLEIGGNCTFDTASMTFTNLRTTQFWSASPIVTMLSELKVTTLTLVANLPITFAGAFGFTASNFIVNTAVTTARTINYAAGVTYTINNRIEVNGTSALPYTFASSSATIRAKLNIAHGAEQKVTHCNFTRIDSSGTSQNIDGMLLNYQFNGNANDYREVLNGTASNVTYTDGKVGKAAVFNGVSSRVIAPSTTITDFRSGAGSDLPFNLTFWLYNSGGATWQFLLNNRLGNTGWQLHINGRAFNFGLLTDAANYLIATTPTISDATWTHVSINYSGSKLFSGISIYIDGSLVSCTNNSVGAYSGLGVGAAVEIGRLTTAYYLNGMMDDLRIFNKVLSGAEISAIYNSGNGTELTYLYGGLVSCWRLDNDFAVDALRNNNGTSTAITYGAGKFGQAAIFDGSTSLISAGATSSFSYMQNTGEFTISFWMKPNALGILEYLMGNTPTSTEKGFSIAKNLNNSINLNVVNGSGVPTDLINVTFNSFFTTTDWQYVTFVATRYSVSVYKDSVLFGTSAATGNLSTGNSTRVLELGKIANFASNKFSGRLQQVMFVSRSLSAPEISQLYNSGNGLEFPSTTVQTSYTSIARTITDSINVGLGEGSRWPLLRKL